MRIAMIIPSLAQTGPGIVARDLCEELVHLGHYCEIFYFDEIFGLETTCKTTKLSNDDLIDLNKWDIIHSHGYRPDRYIAKKYGKKKGTNCKFITTLHQPINFKELYKTYGFFQSSIGSYIWHKSLLVHDQIIVLNSDTYSILPKRLKEKADIIFNGRTIQCLKIEQSDEKLILGLKQRYRIIGTCSSLTKRKGLEQIIKALPELPDSAFIALGDGDQRHELEELAKKLNVIDRVLLLGFKPNSTDYLPYFDVFVMCTRSEGFPLALIEAASKGIPTVLSDIPILKSIVDENMVDFYHLDDIQSLANTIRNCDPNKGSILKSFYLKTLTAKAMADRYLSKYETLLRKDVSVH